MEVDAIGVFNAPKSQRSPVLGMKQSSSEGFWVSVLRIGDCYMFIARMFSPLVFGVIVVASLFGSNAYASEEIKVGFVDLQRALNEVTEGATAKAALKKEFDEKQRTLDAKQTELKAMKEEIDARGMMMTPEAKQERLGQLQQKLMETQQLYVQLQQELSQREAAVTGEIFQKMGTILQTMGRTSDYTLIVEKSAVLYAKNHIDLTNELIRKYNESYGKSAAKK